MQLFNYILTASQQNLCAALDGWNRVRNTAHSGFFMSKKM